MLSAEDRRKFDECCDRIHDIAFLEDYNGEELYEHDLLDQMDCIDGGNDATSDHEMDVATDCENIVLRKHGAPVVRACSTSTTRAWHCNTNFISRTNKSCAAFWTSSR
jgi:hypothetical protein